VVRALQELRYTTTMDDSDIEIATVEGYYAMAIMDRDENILYGPIWAVPRVRVSVSHTETAEPPPIRRTLEGEHARVTYFRARIDSYQKVALEALRRFLRFFKYRRAHALLRDASAADMNTLTWTDETGQELPSNVALPRVLSLYGIELDEEVGVRALAVADDPALQQALAEPPIKPELYEELLSDAHAALFQGHLRRAVLELAISCEVGIRHTFSIKASTRRHKNKKIFHLLDQEAVREFGQSFKVADPRTYADIDHLFQCRDQIAHQGRSHDINQAEVKEWFKAADRLFHWLRRIRP
jgi:hypothetical protein